MNEKDYHFLKFDCVESKVPDEGVEYSKYLEKMGYVEIFNYGQIREITQFGMQSMAEYERNQEQIYKQRAEKARDRRWNERENEKLRRATITAAKIGIISAISGAVTGAITSVIINLIMNHP